MKKQFLFWISILASLVLPAISSAGEGLTDLALAYNDVFGRQRELP
jgi:hypothetical protein